jgi:diguanylate cyclase
MLRDLFVNAVVLIAFVALGSHFLRDRKFERSSPMKYRLLFGLMTGLLACLLMTFSVEVVPGVLVDFRNIPIVMAAIIGGLPASFLTGIIIGIYRILSFGVTNVTVVASIAALAMGICVPLLEGKVKSLLSKWLFSTLLSVVIGSIGFLILVKDHILLLQLLSAYWIGSFMIALLLGYYTSILANSNRLFRKYKAESSLDFLTGLYNVRQFDRIYNDITERIVEKEEQLSLLFIDIDFFKKINDTYGHAEGDLVLKELGKVLLNTCRDFDIVSRNGGEEFSVILLDCPPEKAIRIAERVRSTIEAHPFPLSNGETVNITVSVGISSYDKDSIDFNELLKQADRSLYRAKQTGRNKVVYEDTN